jgi:tetratricopeptide (TPR) repeat protein
MITVGTSIAQSSKNNDEVLQRAEQLFAEQRFAEAYPLFSQLVSLKPNDANVNFKFGATALFAGVEKVSFGTIAPAISEDPIKYHYGKLAKGYAERYNANEGDPTFNEAGVFLHNILFQQYQSPKGSNKPSGEILTFIEEHYKDFDTFKEAFKKIQQKTFYSVNIDIDKFIFDTVEAISKMSNIESEKVRRERSKLDVTKAGVKHDLRIREQSIGDIYEFD